jgi:murein DD-endopeptidase MepM/ murein hydrolase activator NlpD
MPGLGGARDPHARLRSFRRGLGPLLARAAIFVEVMSVLVAAAVMLPSAPAGADAKSDQAQITELGQRIAQDGAQVQQLVVSYDRAQAHQAAVEAQLAAVEAHLAADRRAEARGNSRLRQLALTSYMSGSDEDAALSIFDSDDTAAQMGTQEYMQVASDSLTNAVDAVDIDKQKTQSAETLLQSAQAQADADVHKLADARQAAQTALTNDDALLAQVKGNLQALLAAAAKQYEAAELAQEEAMAARAAAAAKAAQAAQATQGQASAPVTVAFHPTPGSYADPLRSINGLTPERIDQGVDYSGYGPIYAIGDGVVVSTVNGGWPGGTFISYRLSDGPASGLVVYAAEDIDPQVTVGQSVSATTVLGTMYEGPEGIETGWADPSGDGNTMAMDAGQFSGANSTAFGANFSQLLASLGAPPGIAQNEPPTGSLPPGWPAW